MKSLLFAVATMIFGVSAHAEEAPCAASGYQQYGEECLPSKMAEAESLLNNAYDELLARARSEDEWLASNGRVANFENRIKKSQEAWLHYVDLQCALYGDALTSSAWSGIHAEECKIRFIGARVKELNELFAG